MNTPLPRFPFILRLHLCWLLIAGGAGCSLFRNAGTGQHLDAPRPVTHHPVNVNLEVMRVEITTDGSGAVTNVVFKRSSGSEAVDNYVAESIRHQWPGSPSTIAEVELTYSASTGFSDPKLISSRPAS